MLRSGGLDLTGDVMPDETTAVKFHHLLETRRPRPQLMKILNDTSDQRLCCSIDAR
jgi:IS5 family transposase